MDRASYVGDLSSYGCTGSHRLFGRGDRTTELPLGHTGANLCRELRPNHHKGKRHRGWFNVFHLAEEEEEEEEGGGEEECIPPCR